MVEWLPLSAAQQEIWLGQAGERIRLRYKVGQYVEIAGAVDPARLEAAVRRAVAENDAVQLRFDEDGRGLRQAVVPRADWPFPVVDLAGGPDPVRRAEEQMRRSLAEEIDLAGGRLFSSALYRVGDSRFLWFHGYHHFSMDAVSVFLMARRVADLYNDPDGGRAFGRLARLLQSDGDYRSSPRFSADRGYWREQLEGAPGPARISGVAASRSDGIVRCSGSLSPGVVADLKRGRPAYGLAAAVVAATAAYLHRLTGAADVIIGFPVTARSDPALRTIPGNVSNLLPLRLSVDRDAPSGALLRQASAAIFEALKHGRYRGEDIVRDAGFPGSLREYVGPLVNVFPFRYDLLFGESRGVANDLTPGLANDVTVAVYDRSDGRDVRVDLIANAGLFTPEELTAHQERFLRQLNAFGDAGEQGRPIGLVDILGPAERRLILDEWAGAADTAEEDVDAVVPDLFEAQVDRTPDAPAIVHEGTAVTYAELNARANRLARLLAARGVGPESLVAVLLPRSADLVVALLAVLKSGAAYLPLNPEHPDRRIEQLLDDADPALVLLSGTVGLPGGRGRADRLVVDGPDCAALLRHYPEANLTDADRSAPLRPRNPAYVLYTSGSTGTPKGVVVEHRSLANYLAWAASAYPAVRGSTLLHSPVAFDLTVTALYGSLTTGGCLHLAPLDEQWPSRGAGRPTFLKGTPSHLAVLAVLPEDCSPSAELMLGGEPLTGELLADWRLRHPRADVVNSYGPTETTVACTDHRIAAGDPLPAGPVPLGRPIRNVRVYVLDRGSQPTPPGGVGELYVAGAGVARGYYKRPALTAERFLPDPYGPPGSRMYRTGDLVRWRADGSLEFAARADDQVKVNGFRIEPGEIEAALAAHPGLERAAVTVREIQPGDRRLVAYVVPAGGEAGAAVSDTAVSDTELRKHLQERLPEYMVPRAFVTMAALPLTANGKVDRRALPAPDARTPEPHRSREPDSVPEAILCALFAEVLKVPAVGPDEDFFDLGGHSLLALRLINLVRETLGTQLSIRNVFEARTAADLARLLDLDPDFDSDADLVVEG